MGNKFRRYMWVFPVIWMGVIFIFSHQPGNESAELSGGVTKLIVEIFRRINIKLDEAQFHSFIRGGAHFTVFFILAKLWYIALRLRNIKPNRTAILTLGICVVYAVFDETHQYFIPGRASEIMDVLVDSSGAGTAIMMGRLVSWLRGRTFI